MCLLFAAYRQVPGWRLIIAANRDELHARRAAPAAPWPQAPRVVAGRDLEAGGTWLGVTLDGRFAALTNFREGRPRMADAPSRGALVADFLTGSEAAGLYAATVAGRGALYNGFNLLLDDGQSLVYVTNRGGGRPRELAPGVYGLSNHLLDTPWPKVERGRRLFAAALAAGQVDGQALLALMDDRHVPEVSTLPETDADELLERSLSPMFITSPVYGTRCISVLALAEGGGGWFAERRYDERAAIVDTRSFDLPAPASQAAAGGDA